MMLGRHSEVGTYLHSFFTGFSTFMEREISYLYIQSLFIAPIFEPPDPTSPNFTNNHQNILLPKP